MAWTDHVKDIFNFMPHETPFEQELTAYLMAQPTLHYDNATCSRTVFDLMNMDEDLLDYVRALVRTGRATPPCDAAVGHFPLDMLTDRYGFHPVTAVLLCQMYRQKPMDALQFLVMHDSVSADPFALESELRIAEISQSL